MEDSTVVEETQPTEVVSNVVINGQEYSPQDAQDLIALGKTTREHEQKWNTSVDKVWPEYGRSQQTIKQLQAELEQARQSQTQKAQAPMSESQDERDRIRRAAKEAGLVLNDDLSEGGYIKKDELPTYVQNVMREQEAVREVMNTASALEKEIDGTDGRPAFNKKAVLAYASAYNVPDLKKAYEEMYESSLKSWQESQIQKNKTSGLKTVTTSSRSKEPSTVKITDDNVKDMLREALNGGN